MVATITATDGVNVQFSDGTQARRTLGIGTDGVALGAGATIADGADITQGAIADATVAAGAAGTESGKLRRLTTDIDAIKTLLGIGLPAALGGGGGLKASTQGSDATATATLGALNAAATLDTKGLAVVTSEIDTGTLVGTVTFEGTLDDSNWFTVIGLVPTSAGTVGGGTDTVFPSRRRFNVSGLSQFRARVSAYTSGTSASRLRGSAASQWWAPTDLAGNMGVTLRTVGTGNAVDSGAPADAATNGVVGLIVRSYPSAYLGASGWERLRAANFFKTASATASGDTALWTPTSGKKFRALAACAFVTQDASLAAGADLTIKLRDASTDTVFTWDVYVPTLSGTVLGAGWASGWTPVPNGVLSAAANNVLNINLSAALTAGKVRCLVIGSEE